MKYQAIQTRWRSEWDANPRLRQLAAALNGSSTAAEQLAAKRRELASAGTLTQTGLARAVRDHAATATVPVLRRAAATVERARGDIEARRSALAVPSPDPSDLAGAILRADIRTVLRSMSAAEAMGHVLAPDADLATVQAALEAPAFVSGLTPALQADLRKRLVDARCGDQIDALEAEAAAVELAGSAVAMAVSDLRNATDFNGDETAFDRWMQAASAETDRELAGEEVTARPTAGETSIAEAIDRAISEVLNRSAA